jgi:hypothetical protein
MTRVWRLCRAAPWAARTRSERVAGRSPPPLPRHCSPGFLVGNGRSAPEGALPGPGRRREAGAPDAGRGGSMPPRTAPPGGKPPGEKPLGGKPLGHQRAARRSWAARRMAISSSAASRRARASSTTASGALATKASLPSFERRPAASFSSLARGLARRSRSASMSMTPASGRQKVAPRTVRVTAPRGGSVAALEMLDPGEAGDEGAVGLERGGLVRRRGRGRSG